MTGLLYALAPLAAAAMVAHRDPRHGPVRDALGASALYSFATWAEHVYDPMGLDPSPRAALVLWALVAAISGRAYARAFGWRWTESRICSSVLATFVGLVFFWCAPVSPWTIATWGPFVASSVGGALAVWVWWSSPFLRARRSGQYLVECVKAGIGGRPKPKPPGMTITQRVALVLLASDVCMLAFIRWPGVQAWQGRAAALAVTVVQVAWLLKPDTRSAP